MASDVLVRDEGAVRVISFNRPDRHNALSDELLASWRSVLAETFRERSVRCIVLRGEGPSFCSGRDLEQLGARDAGRSDFAFILDEQREALALRDAPQPVVVALHGHVIGGAFELALHADLRIAATNARMSLPEITLGLVPDIGGVDALHRLVGPSRTKRLVMTGDVIDATTALEWGAVDEVVEPTDLDGRVIDVASRLAAAPPQAMQRAKKLIDDITDASVRAGLRRQLRAQVDLFAGAEHGEIRAGLRDQSG